MRLMTFTLTRSAGGGDGILAVAQILTPSLSGGMWVGVESGVVVLKTTRLPGAVQ
jgi:hypothetical protein